MSIPIARNREKMKGWREFFWIWALRRALKLKRKNPVLTHNSSDKKQALVLVDGSDKTTWPIADTVVSFLRKHGFQMEQLAFIADKQEHSDVKCSYFNLKSISWQGRPGGDMITAFEKRNWEVIVGIHRGVCVPISWLVHQFNAPFAFGPLTDPCVYNIALDGHLDDLQGLPRHLEQLFLTISSQKYVRT